MRTIAIHSQQFRFSVSLPPTQQFNQKLTAFFGRLSSARVERSPYFPGDSLYNGTHGGDMCLTYTSSPSIISLRESRGSLAARIKFVRRREWPKARCERQSREKTLLAEKKMRPREKPLVPCREDLQGKPAIFCVIARIIHLKRSGGLVIL